MILVLFIFCVLTVLVLGPVWAYRQGVEDGAHEAFEMMREKDAR